MNSLKEIIRLIIIIKIDMIIYYIHQVLARFPSTAIYASLIGPLKTCSNVTWPWQHLEIRTLQSISLLAQRGIARLR